MNLIDSLSDVLNRLKKALPITWFKDETPIIDSVLTGIASCYFEVYSSIKIVLPQLRISTASDGILDMIAGDFFNVDLLRMPEESDDNYRSRILINLFRETGTKRAMSSALGLLTGIVPVIYEYGQDIDPSGYIITKGNDTVTDYGDVVKPHHAFITVYVLGTPLGQKAAGYGTSSFGYGVGRGMYLRDVRHSYSNIFQLINSIKPEGTKIWIKIIPTLTTSPDVESLPFLDISAVLDQSYTT